MKKLSILALLVIGLLVFVGCDQEISVSISDTIIEDYTEWGENTVEEPHVSFLLEGSDLDMMDIGWIDSVSWPHYTVNVIEVRNNIIIGTYYDDSSEENPKWDVEITFSYSAPILTLNINGDVDGDLYGKTYHLEPAP
jgi:hypothetical protein